MVYEVVYILFLLQRTKITVNFALQLAMKLQKGITGIALDGGTWSEPHPDCFTAPEPGTHPIGRWRPHGRSGRVQKISPPS